MYKWLLTPYKIFYQVNEICVVRSAIMNSETVTNVKLAELFFKNTDKFKNEKKSRRLNKMVVGRYRLIMISPFRFSFKYLDLEVETGRSVPPTLREIAEPGLIVLARPVLVCSPCE